MARSCVFLFSLSVYLLFLPSAFSRGGQGGVCGKVFANMHKQAKSIYVEGIQNVISNLEASRACFESATQANKGCEKVRADMKNLVGKDLTHLELANQIKEKQPTDLGPYYPVPGKFFKGNVGFDERKKWQQGATNESGGSSKDAMRHWYLSSVYERINWSDSRQLLVNKCGVLNSALAGAHTSKFDTGAEIQALNEINPFLRAALRRGADVELDKAAMIGEYSKIIKANKALLSSARSATVGGVQDLIRREDIRKHLREKASPEDRPCIDASLANLDNNKRVADNIITGLRVVPTAICVLAVHPATVGIRTLACSAGVPMGVHGAGKEILKRGELDEKFKRMPVEEREKYYAEYKKHKSAALLAAVAELGGAAVSAGAINGVKSAAEEGALLAVAGKEAAKAAVSEGASAARKTEFYKKNVEDKVAQMADVKRASKRDISVGELKKIEDMMAECKDPQKAADASGSAGVAANDSSR